MADDEQDHPYVDPNSGAAPQPGGYAGAGGVALGHGSTPPGYQRDEDGTIAPANAIVAPGDSQAPFDRQAEEADGGDPEDPTPEPEPEPTPEPEPEPTPEPEPEPEKPAAPVLTSPEGGAEVNAGGVPVSGMTEQDGSVVIYDGEQVVGSASAVDGVFSTTVSLAPGEHSLSACVAVNSVESDWSEVVEITAVTPAPQAGGVQGTVNDTNPGTVQSESANPEPGEKDYSEVLAKSVPDVLEYVKSHPDDKAGITAAEKQREKPRRTLLDELEG